MQDVYTCSLKEFECVAELRVSPIYMSFPKVYQKHLIPENLQERFNNRWGAKRTISPSLKIHLLKDVFVLAQGLIFTRDGTLVFETVAQHSEHDIKLAFDELTRALACASSIPSQPKGILCKKRGAENYGHWLVEMLPKAFWATRLLNLGDDWPAVIFQTAGRMYDVVKQSLGCIGFGAEKVITTDRSVYHFEELLVLEGLTQHSIFMSPLVFECMEFVASKAQVTSQESLYVSRKSVRSRSFENEEEVANFFTKRGYNSIDCGELSFLEQVSAFKSARRLAGPMGAAFTNAVFSQPNTEMLMFMPASAQEYFFWHISEGKKLDYHEVRCAESGPQRAILPWSRDIYISVDALEILSQHLESKQEIELSLLELEGKNLDFLKYISDKTWTISFSHSQNQKHELHFDVDGRISKYRHENECFWRIRSGQLEILNQLGALSWVFSIENDEKQEEKETSPILRGIFFKKTNISATLAPC